MSNEDRKRFEEVMGKSDEEKAAILTRAFPFIKKAAAAISRSKK